MHEQTFDTWFDAIVATINTFLIAACAQNVYSYYRDMWMFIGSTACVDKQVRGEGGPLLDGLCHYYAGLSDHTSLEKLVTATIYLNYKLIATVCVFLAGMYAARRCYYAMCPRC